MNQVEQIVTAETEAGRAAIEEVMARSYRTELGNLPAKWWRALLVDDVPVSFIRVDPHHAFHLPGGTMRVGFVADVATRQDRRREGHFRRLMELTYADLLTEGVSAMTLHGSCLYYRPLGFEVYSHNFGVFISAEQVEQQLGCGPSGGEQRIAVEEHRAFLPDLLVVPEVRAANLQQAKVVLIATSQLARERGKARILFEMPGADNPSQSPLETPFVELARACGAQVIISASDPEGRRIDHANWLKALDVFAFVKQAVPLLNIDPNALVPGSVYFETEAGGASLSLTGGKVTIERGQLSGAFRLSWPAGALVHLLLGYKSVATLAEIHGTPLANEMLHFLQALFPRRWCFSRNEDWVFTQ